MSGTELLSPAAGHRHRHECGVDGEKQRTNAHAYQQTDQTPRKKYLGETLGVLSCEMRRYLVGRNQVRAARGARARPSQANHCCGVDQCRRCSLTFAARRK
eukprot:6208534-Pleurochrysis_carterae.AAC.4